MNDQYQQFDPSSCGFPSARVPVLPQLGRQSLGRSREPSYRLAWPDRGALTFARARYALHQAYALSGVGPDGSLLAPAYHCRTLLDPAIRLAAPVHFYAQNADLSPDIEQVKKALQDTSLRIKAVLLPHYFGFAQATRALSQLCERHGVALIEDCSHALIDAAPIAKQTANASDSACAEAPIGTAGHYAVGSPYKFFACEDGGLLWGNQPPHPLVKQTRPVSIKNEVRAAMRATVAWLRPPATPPDEACLRQDISRLLKTSAPSGKDGLVTELHTSIYYQSKEEDSEGLRTSKWIVAHSNVPRLIEQRRHNYLRWLQAMTDIPHCRPLFKHLPDDCVPYMFALLIDHPSLHFMTLKRLGMPLWRWDDMAVSSCATAKEYRLRLLHLPCHQELTSAQMTWMIEAVTRVMNEQPVVAPAL